MDDPPTRSLRPARIVALVLIALVALGLAYLRFGTGESAVSVPSGAKAGDLTLERCDYATEDGSYEADCGHTDDFWTHQTAAGTRLINTFFDSGRVDRSLYTPTSVDFTPAISHGGIAKILLGVLLGLAALTVLSLLWMALRVRWRGAFGPYASATLRSVYPIVLGLGGWCLGILIVLTALPTVPLVDEGLAVVSIGIPIGIGTYWASATGVGSRRSRIARFGATMAGALIGAWLGFNVTSAAFGLFAPLLAIVGATAGANLTLIALQIAAARAARSHVTAAAPSPASA